MPDIKANVDVCEGYGNCVLAAPRLFDLDDDGVVVVLKATIEATERAQADEAVLACPVRALRVEND